LVAVNERVIASNAERIGRGERREIHLVTAVSEQLLRSREGGFQQGAVASAGGPAVFRELPIVDRLAERDGDPDWLSIDHSASLRSRSRSSRMMVSATSSCRANSSSYGLRMM